MRDVRDDVLALAVAVAATIPLFVHRGDVLTEGAKILLLLLAAMGLNIAMGYAGSPSLGQGGFAAVGAYGVAILVGKAGWDPVAAVLAATAIAAVVAWAVAVGVARLRPPFVALTTWLFAWAVAFAIGAFPALTGGDRGIPVGQPALGLRSIGVHVRPGPPAYFEIALAAVAGGLVLHTNLIRRAGAALAAVRTDASAARAAGVPVEAVRIRSLTAAGAIGGLAGALLVLNAGVADPSSYGPLLSVKLFVVVLLGGVARRLGPAAGLVAVLAISALAAGAAHVFGSSATDVEPIAAAAVLGSLLLFGTDGLIPSLERRARPSPRSFDAAPASIPTVHGGAVRADGIRVSFGGVVALAGCSIDAAPGTCHAIVGPNGSGKTTLLRVLGGAVAPDSGTVRLDGFALTPAGPHRRARDGIVRTLQRTVVQERTSTIDFVAAGVEATQASAFAYAALATPGSRAERALTVRRARRAIGAVGLEGAESIPMGSLNSADQRLLQIARAIASGPRVLLLDEPSAGFGRAAERRLIDVVTMLRDRGMTVIVVEHNLRVVRQVADRVSVLDAGTLIAEGTPVEVERDPAVQAAYLGGFADSMAARATMARPSRRGGAGPGARRTRRV